MGAEICSGIWDPSLSSELSSVLVFGIQNFELQIADF